MTHTAAETIRAFLRQLVFNHSAGFQALDGHGFYPLPRLIQHRELAVIERHLRHEKNLGKGGIERDPALMQRLKTCGRQIRRMGLGKGAGEKQKKDGYQAVKGNNHTNLVTIMIGVPRVEKITTNRN